MRRDADACRRTADATRAALRRRAEARRCPRCGRAGALVDVPNCYPAMKTCRYRCEEKKT